MDADGLIIYMDQVDAGKDEWAVYPASIRKWDPKPPKKATRIRGHDRAREAAKKLDKDFGGSEYGVCERAMGRFACLKSKKGR